MNQPIIEMKGVSKVFEIDDIQTHALQSIDLVVQEGQYLSITGPSGCGKSSLLSIMGLLDAPTSGEYKIDGQSVSSLSYDAASKLRNKKIGFIFQSFNLIDEISVFDNVALPLRYSDESVSSEAMAQRVTECLELVGLGHRLNHKPNQLSGGQQQRVAIARALVANPSVLLVDEPTGNLDSKSGDQIMDILDDLNAQGRTICMVTHDARYATRAKTQLNLLDGQLSYSEVERLEAV
ncbi:ABC transporter ATP-binding protein [Pseudoalteromonas umbrosa]|uniref:ABC transporter ATP-binding protein n=1 Tax=Pseudoalteromonas umbrosa TaxID=3048489 RepID=UPI0024C2FC12|nr:ABC transporter ATP-binding protein [Pseudoalteromonas sp. B95]MDK1288844.1 ABC transporter ATP-binding protein [Pseudoalteromonas sp. B95]